MALNFQIIETIADLLLIAGAFGAGFYCIVLAKRLRRLNDLEGGVGGAVAVLSAQVDDLSKMMAAAQSQVSGSSSALGEMTERAEDVARRLELMVASLHDLPEGGEAMEKAITESHPADAPESSDAKDASSEPADQPKDLSLGITAGGLPDEQAPEPQMMFRARQSRGAA